MPAASRLRDLVSLVERLRAPDGCPWDREQTIADLRAFLLEEAHEVAAALDTGQWSALAEELGDLLFQIAFLVRLGEEAEALSLEQILAGVHRKMVERHPHVFADERRPDAAAVHRAWEQRKATAGDGGLLAGVPSSLPALVAAYRISQKAAGVGFDWPDPPSVAAKVEEELTELRAEMGQEDDDAAADRRREEVGDLLFATASLSRHLGVDPEAALAAANEKFRRRFRRVEEELGERGLALGEVALEELETLWESVKGEEGR